MVDDTISRIPIYKYVLSRVRFFYIRDLDHKNQMDTCNFEPCSCYACTRYCFQMWRWVYVHSYKMNTKRLIWWEWWAKDWIFCVIECRTNNGGLCAVFIWSIADDGKSGREERVSRDRRRWRPSLNGGSYKSARRGTYICRVYIYIRYTHSFLRYRCAVYCPSNEKIRSTLSKQDFKHSQSDRKKVI